MDRVRAQARSKPIYTGGRGPPTMECRLCGSGETSEFAAGVTRCSACEAIFRDSPQAPSRLQEYFEDGYYKRRVNPLRMKVWELLARQYMSYLRRKTSMDFASALDVGTFHGHLVKMLKGEGIRARGIEPDREKVASAVTDGIEQGYFDEDFDPGEQFDLICLNEMLYYLPDGVAALRHARTMLRDGGLVLISTANPSSTMITGGRYTSIENEWVNCFMSRKNFESLDGFELVDYAPFRGNMLHDFQYKSRAYVLLYLAGLKKVNTFDPDGNHVLVLLKKV